MDMEGGRCNRVLASQNSLPIEMQTKKLIRKSCAVTLFLVWLLSLPTTSSPGKISLHICRDSSKLHKNMTLEKIILKQI